MKNVFIITFIILLSIFTIVMAQGNIKLNITAEKTEFLLGEPVIVYVTLTNTGNEPIRVSPEVAPEKDTYVYFITDPAGSTKRFGPVYVTEPDEIKTLAKNESVGGAARIFYGGQGYYFTEPGEYKVVVRYDEADSPPLMLSILEPRDEAEREQANLILDHPEVGLFLMLEGGDELADAHAQMETLNQKYPNSLLTAYVRYAQAKNYSVPARNFVIKKPRDADYQKAIEIFDTLKDKEIQLFYKVRSVNALSACLDKTGRKDEAKKVLEEFKSTLEAKKDMRQYLIDQIDMELNKTK